jgi:site-specific DNA recombinase
VSTPLHMVEDTLVSILAGWKIDVERVESSKDVSVDPDIIIKVMEKLENEIEVLKKQLNNAHDFLEQGIYDTQTFVERSKIVADKIKAAEQQHKELKKELKKPKLEYEKIPAAVSNYYDLNIEEKNQVLKSILDKVVYRKEIKLIPDAFTLDVYPKTQL